MNRIFITGGAGFIGSNLAGKLLGDPGCHITVYDNLSSGRMAFLEPFIRDSRFHFVEADLLDRERLAAAIRGHDLVFHLAANPDISRAMEETDLDLRLSILATYNVVEAMRLSGVARIAYASGSGVYGDVGATPTAEDFGPLLPASMYGACKLGAEAIISAFCHMFELQAWIFRFANVVGRHQTHGVGYDFIRRLRENPRELTILGDGGQSKAYVHVDDAIAAMLLSLAESDEQVNLFNVAPDDALTVDEIATIVIGEMHLGDVERTYTGGRRGWKGDVPVVRFDTKKINALGWRTSCSSKEAVRRSIQELLHER